MKIHNVRLGFATNSSSSHSMIFLPNVKDDVRCYEKHQYGWEQFTLASREAKLPYLSQILGDQIATQSGKEIAKTVVREWLGTEFDPEGGIDHNTDGSLPLNFDGGGLCREFVEEWRDWMLRDGLVILGGNDNDGDHPLTASGEGKTFDFANWGGMVARKDPTNKFWTLFSRETGNKARVSFQCSAPKPIRSSIPELVDVKITDHCTNACKYCYQGSSERGQHATREELWHIARALGSMGVFEVAIGGGEPLNHPNFAEILSTFKHQGVTPNFTTRRLDWLTDPMPEAKGKRDKILNDVGGWAYSVNTPEQVKKFADALLQHGIHQQRGRGPNVQYVMGSTSLDGFKKVLLAAAEARIGVTLLGYKSCGRGSEFKVHNYTGWVDVWKPIVEKHYVTTSIDTVLAAQSQEAIEDAGVPDWCYSMEEGMFSMYIDAVRMRTGPSSFCQEELMKYMHTKAGYYEEQILAAYSKFPRERAA